MLTPFGYAGVATTLPISASPGVVVTGLLQADELPDGRPPVETSSCFHTIEFVAGLNAISRLIETAFGTAPTFSWITLPTPLITGCWSAAGGASTAKLCTLAQTYSNPVLWLN